MKIKTIYNGCETNLFDSERIKEYLLARNFIVSSQLEVADIAILHSCTFSSQKENETIDLIRKLQKSSINKIIVTGCYLKKYINDSKISYVKNEELTNFFASIKPKSYDEKSTDELLPFVQISRGCYGNCSFCSIRTVKGVHKSRTIEEIICDISVRQHLGFIKLVGDEVAGYGRDIGLNLALLIKEIIKSFPNIKIKLGSLNVKILKLYSEEELAVFSHINIIGNIHIPVQSASNSILKKMARGYTIEEYQNIYNKLISYGVKNISGDLICGFPEEDNSDHQKNIDIILKNKYQFFEIFAYDEREGTKAAEMEQLDYATRKNRATEVILHYLKNYCKNNNINYSELHTKNNLFNTNIKF